MSKSPIVPAVKAKLNLHAENLSNEDKTMHQYLRNAKGERIGVMVAVSRTKNGKKEFGIGFSLCREGDKFDKIVGFNKAYSIARASDRPLATHRYEILAFMESQGVLDRCHQFFIGKVLNKAQAKGLLGATVKVKTTTTVTKTASKAAPKAKVCSGKCACSH